MIRRFVYDSASDRVVEVGEVRPAAGPGERYGVAHGEYYDRVKRTVPEAEGARLVEAALERADARQYAHRRFGDERRWRS